MSKKNILLFTLPALGAAIIIVLSQIVIPIGTVPFTLQTLAIGLIATLFKKREAFLSVLLYLLLGMIGLPVFAGGSSGFSVLFGPTGGFYLGFLFFALVTSAATSSKSSFLRIFLANLLGDSIAFFCGVLGLLVFAKMSLQAAFLAGALPFILPDLIKLFCLTFLSKSLFKALRNQNYFSN